MKINKNYIFSCFTQNFLEIALGISLVAAILMHGLLTMQIDFMSDDYSLIHSAQNNLRFWHLHSSIPLEFLWHKTAEGHISAFTWHIALLIVHTFNVGLLYVLASRWCRLDTSYSLLVATFYALSPAGIEALAWTCSAGYVLTMTWILTSLLCFLAWKQNPAFVWVKGTILALMQLVALLTWEWAILIFPVLCVFSLIGNNKGWKLLLPVGICWLAAVFMRSISDHGVFWQNNDLITAGRFLVGSPLLGLFPNLNKETYFSAPILVLFAGMVVVLAWAAWQQKIVLVLLICFFGSILPWVKGGNPSSRYFYLSMPFLYLAIAVSLERFKYQRIAWGVALLLLATQFWNTYERAILWVEADRQAHVLMDQTLLLLASANHEKKIVLVNIPEAYGPTEMSMRPQMWYCGFKEYLSDKGIEVTLVKTDDSPFVWHKSLGRLPRSLIATMNTENSLYEIVYDSDKFVLIPFMVENNNQQLFSM